MFSCSSSVELLQGKKIEIRNFNYFNENETQFEGKRNLVEQLKISNNINISWNLLMTIYCHLQKRKRCIYSRTGAVMLICFVLLLLRGSTFLWKPSYEFSFDSRFDQSTVELLLWYEAIFGKEMWKHVVVETTFWSHSTEAAALRFNLKHSGGTELETS